MNNLRNQPVFIRKFSIAVAQAHAKRQERSGIREGGLSTAARAEKATLEKK
jgi:hypothetical protein